jgi:hypothetical protein
MRRLGSQPRGRCKTSRLQGGLTYKRGHGANQIDDDVQPIRADDFLIADFLADGEVPQSEKLNVGIVRVIALRFSLSAIAPFQGATLVSWPHVKSLLCH